MKGKSNNRRSDPPGSPGPYENFSKNFGKNPQNLRKCWD